MIDAGRLAKLDPAALPAGRHALRCQVAAGADGPVGCDAIVLRGAPGPLLLTVAAVHGDEYEGPAALARLAATLRPEALTGTLVAIPVVNEPACFAQQRCSPLDGQNLARVFSGRPDGTVSEQTAAALTALMARADAFCDLHAAGTAYTLHPWAGYGVHPDPAIQEQQRRMAFAFGLDFVWGTPMKPGRSLSAAAELGLPAIYVEQTGSGLCRPADVAANIRGLSQLLGCLGMLATSYPTAPPAFFRESWEADEGHLQLDHPAPASGLFRPRVAVWDRVAAGQPLGWVETPGGFAPQPVTAARAGRVAMLRTAPPVAAGDSLAVVTPV